MNKNEKNVRLHEDPEDVSIEEYTESSEQNKKLPYIIKETYPIPKEIKKEDKLPF